LTVWHSWDVEEEEIVRELLVDFQNAHPGVTVRLRQVPVDRLVAEYEEAVLAGEGPDLLAGWSHWVGGLADKEVIAPLEGLLEEEYWGEFYHYALDGVRYQEHLYAVPYACDTVALYFNRDFISEPPTTTLRLLELAANWPGPEQAGLALPVSFFTSVGYLYAFGGGLFDDAGMPTINTPETHAWLAWLQEVRAAPGVVAADSYGEADARFKAGSVAMVVMGSWALSDYVQTLGPERLGVAVLPMLDRTGQWPTPLVGYLVLMANPVYLSHPSEATLDLLRFLGGPVLQGVLAGRLGRVPTWGGIDLAGNLPLATFVLQAGLGRPRPMTPGMEVLWDPIESLLYKVTSRGVPIDVALEETQRQVEAALLEQEDGP
jgi:arabinogalactan oligomer/maltooligosaccharide transport system substrate-binding protein